MERWVFGPGTLVLGGGAFLLIAFLAVGFLLPGTWQAAVEVRLPHAPADLRPFIETPEGWRAWTTWPDSVTSVAPEEGAGGSMSWDDPELGTGTFRILEVGEDGGVRYAVEVQGAGGSVMRTEGGITLTPAGDSTVVRWHEEGDLGANPLMGYWALSMERAQSREMRKSLDRLATLLGQAPTPSPAPTR